MSDQPSLGQLYAASHHPALPELPGSLGEQYSNWLSFVPVREPVAAAREVRVGPDDTQLIPEARAVASAARRARADRERARREGPPGAVAPTPGRRAARSAAPKSDGGVASLARSSAVMAAGSLVSKLLGFVRLILSAYVIGSTTRVSNIFDTANTLPNQIYLLLAGGVINVIFVPQITRALRHPDGGKAYTDRLITLSLSLLLAITLIMVAAAPLLYRVFDGEASGSRLHLGVVFTVVCVPQVFFYGFYTLFGEVLNARGRFGAFMWSPVLANLVMITGLLVVLAIAPERGAPPEDWTPSMIAALAGSATLGIVIQGLILIWPLKRAGYVFTPRFGVRGVGLRSTSKIAGWAFALIILQQLALLVTFRVLNAVPDHFGGKAAQSIAFALFMLPHGIVTVSLVTALFTQMSVAAGHGDKATVARDVRLGFLLSGPAAVATSISSFALIMPLAGVLPGDHGSRFAIGATTISMMAGLVPFTFGALTQRVFYAFEDARTPFNIQVIGSAVTVAGALAASTLPPRWVLPGVAFAQTLSYLVQALVGFAWLRRLLGPIEMGEVRRTYVRLAVAAVAGTALAGLIHLLDGVVLDGKARDAVTLVVGGVVFAVVFVAVARRLRVREVEQLIGAISSRVPGLSRA